MIRFEFSFIFTRTVANRNGSKIVQKKKKKKKIPLKLPSV